MQPQDIANKSRISAFGASFPSQVVTSDDIAEKIGVPKGWIEERTGIKERRFLASGEENSDIAAAAALQALERAGKTPADVDLIIACTNSPDRWMPSLAATVQAKIGARPGTAAYDLITACAGWMSGLQMADAFIKTGTYETVLVIGSEAMSRFLNWKDNTTCVLFGDGAGACVVEPCEAGAPGEILSLIVRADGRHGDILEFPATGSAKPANMDVVEKGLHLVRMDGDKVFFHAVRHMSGICQEVLNACSLQIGDIDWFVPHQANEWIVKFVGQKVGVPEQKVALNLDRFGNTTAATVPTCFEEYVRTGKVQRGHLVLIASFGGGLSWAGGLIRW